MAKAPVKSKSTKAAEKVKPVEKVEVKKTEKPAVEKKKPKTVLVKNLTKVRFTQPSSGVTVYGQDEKPLNIDGWLENQINAGFMEVVD